MNLADQPSTSRVLYLVVCAAPPARDVHVLVDLAQKVGWDACVVATPRAFQWIDAPPISERTAPPGRYDKKLPAGAFNSTTKGAPGISDPPALGLLWEAMGMELPVVVLPYLNAAQGKHPALADSIQRLRGCGVQVLFGPDVLPLHRPREGRRELFPWQLTLAALDAS